MHHTFDTPEPVELYVEISSGAIAVTAERTTETKVEVTGKNADNVTVEQNGHTVSIVAPRERLGFLSGGDSKLQVTVSLPTGSSVVSRTGSADLDVIGVIDKLQTKSGSGDIKIAEVTGPASVDSGSGDLIVDIAAGPLRVKSGSGDIVVRSSAEIGVSTGSGDTLLSHVTAASQVKSGSGDLLIERCSGDVSFSTGSGDLQVTKAERGSVTVKNASGDVTVGVPSGLPVWTDISSLSGSIRSNLDGAGQPQDGADHLEIRATSVSGDITLRQI